MADKYDFEYKEVKCTQVDWEKDLFEFEYKKHTFKYKCKRYVSQSSDLDHIAVVIGIFLEELRKDSEDKIISLLNYLEERLNAMESIMSENEETDLYIEGQYYAFIALRDKIRNMEGEANAV